jgi:hypothetical protein
MGECSAMSPGRVWRDRRSPTIQNRVGDEGHDPENRKGYEADDERLTNSILQIEAERDSGHHECVDQKSLERQLAGRHAHGRASPHGAYWANDFDLGERSRMSPEGAVTTFEASLPDRSDHAD